jgi:hypothetical protein
MTAIDHFPLEEEVCFLWNSQQMILTLLIFQRNVLDKAVKFVVFQHPKGKVFKRKRKLYFPEHFHPNLNCFCG